MHGTTTAEIKTGYGLDTATELKMLDAIRAPGRAASHDLVPTFECSTPCRQNIPAAPTTDVDLVVNEMLPAIGDLRYIVETPGRRIQHPRCRFLRRLARSVRSTWQSRRIHGSREGNGGLFRIHADEFEPLGRDIAGR